MNWTRAVLLVVTLLLALGATAPEWEFHRRVSVAALMTMTMGLLFRLAEAAEAVGDS